MDIDNNIPTAAKATEDDICDTDTTKQLEETVENKIENEISLPTV